MDFTKLQEMFNKLGTLRLAVWHTQGIGPSSTKIVYINMGLVGVYGWLLMVATMCGVYIGTGEVNPVLAGVVTTVLGLLIGFSTSAQKAKNREQVEAMKSPDSPPGGSS